MTQNLMFDLAFNKKLHVLPYIWYVFCSNNFGMSTRLNLQLEGPLISSALVMVTCAYHFQTVNHFVPVHFDARGFQ